MVRARGPHLTQAEVAALLRWSAQELSVEDWTPEGGAGRIEPIAATYWAYNTGWTPQTPHPRSYHPVNRRYAELGGERSPLGRPTVRPVNISERPLADVGRYQHGSIFWVDRVGAHEVYGAIHSRYAALGSQRSVLRFPVTGERRTPDGRGRFNHFQGGSIYWTPTTGAQEIYGEIRNRWSRIGWELGPLGYPVTGERATPTKFGRFNHFQHGSIYWSPSTGAHEVYGAIRRAWAAQGWETGRLGFPTTGEYAMGDWRANNFQGGQISWNRRTGRVVVSR